MQAGVELLAGRKVIVRKKPRKRSTRKPTTSAPHSRTTEGQPNTAAQPESLTRRPTPASARRPTAAGPTTREAPRPTRRSSPAEQKQPAARGWLASTLKDVEPQSLAITYSFDAPHSGPPYSFAIRFSGTRTGIRGAPRVGDRFDQIERVRKLSAHNCRVALTTRVSGINSGSWTVTATPVEQPAPVRAARRLPRRVITATTAFGQLAQGPGVRLAAWPALVGLGATVAVTMQAVLSARAGVNVATVIALSLIGSLLGFVGGKVWCLVLHRKHPREFMTAGACIQGFLVVALAVVAFGAAQLRLPVGTLLDSTTPGLFFGIAFGRPGCLLTGCCAGRPTDSRWGIWSSDRRLAVRRLPVQLFEAATGLVIASVSLPLVLNVRSGLPGIILIGALAAYTLCRQLLFPLRAESRTPRGRTTTMIFCGLLLVSILMASLFA